MKIIEGRISSPFGDRIHPIEKKLKFHNGIDIACSIGTLIYSPIEGKIMKVYFDPCGGNTLIIGDENNMRFGFCHLSKVFFPEGTRIKKGHAIAESGNTGRITGAHVHFTVKEDGQWQGSEYVGGKWVNPEKYLEL